MKKLLRVLLVVSLMFVFILSNISAFSQEKKKTKKKEKTLSVSYASGTDSILDLPTFLSEYLEHTTSRHFQDPSIPRFLIKDRKGNFAFGVGGYIGAIGYYDYDNTSPPNFNVNAIRVPNRGSHNDVMNLDMGSSRLFLKLIGKTKMGMISAYIETSFDNENHYLKLRHAYVEMLGFKVGLSHTTFTDSESPNIIDNGGLVSATDRRLSQIRYSYRFNEEMTLAAALEFSQSTSSSIPRVGDLENVDVSDVPQRFPDLPITFTLDKDRYHLFAGVNTRVMKDSEHYEKFKRQFGYALQLAGNVDIYKGDTFTHKIFAQGIYTHGMEDCIQDLDGLGMNIVVDKSFDDFYLMQAYGAYLGYQMLWKKNQINATYSMTGVIFPPDMSANLYKNGQFLAVNYVRDLFNHARMGLEGVCGRRTNLSGEFGMDFRINLLLRYDF